MSPVARSLGRSVRQSVGLHDYDKDISKVNHVNNSQKCEFSQYSEEEETEATPSLRRQRMHVCVN